MSENSEQKRLPMLNEPAPDFEGTSTHGPIRLSSYKEVGKWVLLFSHPADFTPVCTTEFVEFAKSYPEFQKRNVELIGLSVDSTYSHLGWIRNIEQNFGVKIPFPVISDLNMAIAQLYGMVHPGASDTATVRCVFFIDPKGIVRAMIYYPLQAGRNVEEIVRLIDALQTIDEMACATPANWKPGDEVIVPPPQTYEGAEKRKEEGFNYIDWYFSKKKVKT